MAPRFEPILKANIDGGAGAETGAIREAVDAVHGVGANAGISVAYGEREDMLCGHWRRQR